MQIVVFTISAFLALKFYIERLHELNWILKRWERNCEKFLLNFFPSDLNFLFLSHKISLFDPTDQTQGTLWIFNDNIIIYNVFRQAKYCYLNPLN